MTQAIGIDFGTSNSTCAVFDGADTHLIPLEGQHLTLPSAIFFHESGALFFGREATRAYIEGEDGRLMRGLKSTLGTSLMSERTIINRKSMSFIDVLTVFIRNIKKKAESHLGATVENVVLGRPVHFHDNNPDADDESERVLGGIAASLGFKNIVFQYEPIAAAFAHERKIKHDKLALVVDLGGGTSDFAVVKLFPHTPLDHDRRDDILATTGVRVGGTNFDKRLSMSSFMPYLGLGTEYRSSMDPDKILSVPLKIYADLSDWPLVNGAQTHKAIRETQEILRQSLEPKKVGRLLKLQTEKMGHGFLQVVEQVKIDLTEKIEVVQSLSRLGLDFDVHVSRTMFEDSIREQIAKICRSMDECVRDAVVTSDDIEIIILTGGSSELPVINRLVSERFPCAEISRDDKFGSVGLGLAYNAGSLLKNAIF